MSSIAGIVSNTSVRHLCFRGSILFITGVFFTVMLNFLQIQRNIALMNPSKVLGVLSSPWWVPMLCGLASTTVGLLYPCIDHKLSEHQVSEREWSSVIRCVAIFVGINQASAKIDFNSNLQLSLSLTILSISLWWWFDRTRSGFGLGVAIAVLATFVTNMLVYHGVCQFTERNYLYIRSWLPCIFFSGGITVGNIGRQLALQDYIDIETKRHQE